MNAHDRDTTVGCPAAQVPPVGDLGGLTAWWIPSRVQPYSLIYYMKGTNKGIIRLDVVYAPLATEFVSKDITAGDPADQNSSCMGDYYYYRIIYLN